MIVVAGAFIDGACCSACVFTGFSAEHSSDGLGRPRSAAAARNHPLLHQTDVPETRQGTVAQHRLTRVAPGGAVVTVLCLATEHHPGPEEELRDCQADHGISRVLPPTRGERIREQRPVRFDPGGRQIHLPGGQRWVLFGFSAR